MNITKYFKYLLSKECSTKLVHFQFGSTGVGTKTLLSAVRQLHSLQDNSSNNYLVNPC